MRGNDCGARAVFCPAAPGEEDLAFALSEDYVIRTEPARPGRQLRYVATARRADVSPHTLVTADPAELLAALTQPHPSTPASGLNPATLGDVHSGRFR